MNSIAYSMLVIAALALVANGAIQQLTDESSAHTFLRNGQSSGVLLAKVGDTKLYSNALLNASSYYWARGSYDALTDEMRKHRVGGIERVHVFHLPEGPAMLKDVPYHGTRRASISSLLQLEQGMSIQTTFPEYHLADDYTNPLSHSNQELESTTVDKVTPDLLETYLTEITTLPDQNTPTRSWSNPDATADTVKYLKDKFTSMGYTTCVQSFGNEGQKNVLAFKAGSNDKVAVMGAHYDSRPFTGAAPGAVDNGSGIAMVLALAQLYAEAKVEPERSVYFVGFAAEEPGLKGSAGFASALEAGSLPDSCSTKNAPKTGDVSAIVLDEVGWKSPNLDHTTVNLEAYDTLGQDVMEHCAAASQTYNGDSLKVVHSNNPFGSDHMSFFDRNMHASLIIQGDDEGYPDYHQSTDAITNVDFTMTSLIGKMNLGCLFRLAGVDDSTTQASE